MDRKIIFVGVLFLSVFQHQVLFSQCKLGNNYAVFFGVSDYQPNSGWPDLRYPISDIESLAQLLHEHYAFDTILHRNPTETEIWDQLYALKDKTNWAPNDQLLLFFSGHGAPGGYFIPANGRRSREQSTALALDHSFRDFLDEIPCNHQLVIIDACYSGTLFTAKYREGNNGDSWKKSLIEETVDQNLQILCTHQSRRTRLALTSAEATSRAPDQSQLVMAFKSMLLEWRYRDAILYTGNIYLQLKKEASSPLFTAFHFSNDPASSFIFLPLQVRRKYEQASPCPLNTLDCLPSERACALCPKDPTNTSYQVVPVKGKLWLAENLAFTNYGNSHCRDCETYGRLYSWEQAQSACKTLGPAWRLPSVREWEELGMALGEGYGTMGLGHSGKGDPIASFEKLMDSKWRPSLGGFKAGKKVGGQGKEGLYWSSDTTNDGFDAYVFSFSKYGFIKTIKATDMALSCRCVKD